MKRYILIFILVVSSALFNGCASLQSGILQGYGNLKTVDNISEKIVELDIEIRNIPWGYLTSTEATPINNELNSKLNQALSKSFSLKSKDARYKLLIGYQGTRSYAYSSLEELKSIVPGYQEGDLLWILEIEAFVYIIDNQKKTITQLTEKAIKVKTNYWGKDFSVCIPNVTDELVKSILNIFSTPK